MKSESRREWRDGWPAIAASLVGSAAAQIHFATIGAFIKPITESMKWSASTVTFGIFICAMVSVPGAPLAGWLAQRFGLVRMISLGLPIFFAAFASLGLFSHSKNEWILGWSLVAIGSVFLKGNIWMYWVTQKFEATRGMAFAIVMTGAGVLGIFIPITTQLLIELVGWRETFLVLAVIMFLISSIACFVGVRLCPPAPGDRNKSAANDRMGERGALLKEAMRSRNFWQLASIALLVGASIISLQVLMIPMFRSKGMDAHAAALIAGLFGAAALAGRLVAGVFLDRYSAKLIGTVSLLMPVLASLLYLVLPVGPGLGAAIAILFGLGVGVEGDVLAYIVSRYFGVRNFATIFGITSGLFALGSGIGPLAMASMFDHFGSYSAGMVVIFFCLLICALLFATLGPYPRVQEDGVENALPVGPHVSPQPAN